MPNALEGIRVLDLSRLLPGPYATMMLADLGAEVIKIEDTSTGDGNRYSSPRRGRDSAMFQLINRNKKSIALDLKKPEGREIFLSLAETADAILEQFRPGVVARLEIGFAAVQKRNPRVVYCSLSGYGQNGPYRDRAGHDINYIALAGVLGLTVDDRGRPVIPGVQIADIAGGMIAAFSILAGLLARAKTARGQYIDVSMFDVVAAMLTVPAAHEFGGSPIGAGGRYTLSGAYPFYSVYETADAKFMSLGALEPKFWENFCRRVGREDLIVRQFDDGDRRKDLFEEMRLIFKSRTCAEWIDLMRDADACCEPVLSMSEAFEHAQMRAREMVLEVEDGRHLGFASKFSDTPARIAQTSPGLGEHTEDLLRGLGLTEEELSLLRNNGTIK